MDEAYCAFQNSWDVRLFLKRLFILVRARQTHDGSRLESRLITFFLDPFSLSCATISACQRREKLHLISNILFTTSFLWLRDCGGHVKQSGLTRSHAPQKLGVLVTKLSVATQESGCVSIANISCIVLSAMPILPNILSNVCVA